VLSRRMLPGVSWQENLGVKKAGIIVLLQVGVVSDSRHS